MIVGFNRHYEHDGKTFHIQVEDLGDEAGRFEARVYIQGSVIWSKRIPYESVIADDMPKQERDHALRTQMEKTLHTVVAAIAKGKIS